MEHPNAADYANYWEREAQARQEEHDRISSKTDAALAELAERAARHFRSIANG